MVASQSSFPAEQPVGLRTGCFLIVRADYIDQSGSGAPRLSVRAAGQYSLASL
jgi:hypothetical protein